MLTFVRFVVAIILGGLLPGTQGSSSLGLGLPLNVCDVLPGLTQNIWQGLGVKPGADDQWDNDANWSLGIAPIHLPNPYVCIPAGGLPLIRSDQVGQIVALGVAEDGLLRIDQGGKLLLSGGALLPSSIRGEVELDGATLGGPATVNLSGTLTLRGVGPSSPATLATGTIAVSDGGTVDVTGGEANLSDRSQLSVHGLVRIRGDGYMTADHGTKLQLLAPALLAPGTGTLRFEGDGSYLEGGNDLGIADLGSVVNGGRIIKSGGSGTSLVSGTYSQPSPGTVTVNSGTLLLPSGSQTAATVSAGAGYGSGECRVPRQAGCQAQTFDGDQQNVQFRVPGSDASGASVIVQELTSASSPDDVGLPVVAHANGLSTTSADPAVISLAYDERLLGGRGWDSLHVFHRADGSSTYDELRPCLANGAPPSGEDACVDRRGLPGSSRNVYDAEGPGNAPDVIMVVRTVTTSRWVVR
jgi:hypothetical protein